MMHSIDKDGRTRIFAVSGRSDGRIPKIASENGTGKDAFEVVAMDHGRL